MDVQIEENGRFGRKLSVTIPADEVAKAFDDVAREIGKSARIPGFRPGKIPRGVIEQHYGSQIRNEVRDRLISDTLVNTLRDRQLAPVSSPHLHLGELERGTAFSYTAEFEVQPEVKLSRYKGLEVPPITVEVAAAEIDAQLEQMRKSAAQLVPVLIRDTVEQGDVVLTDYAGTMGGIPFEGGKADNVLIEIGAEGYLPEFSTGLLGARVPGERVIQVDFPADYNVKDLAGKPASFHVKLKEIKKKELPALDDEFARDLGEESLAALRGKVESNLAAHKRREAEVEQRRKLLESLAAANPFDLPAAMVEQQAERLVDSAAARLEQLTGRRFELSESDKEHLRKDNQQSAEIQVRSGLLLFEIAKAEGLTVDNADVDAEIDKTARAAGPDAPRVLSYYRDPDIRERLRYRLLEEKVVQFLLDNAGKAEAAPSPASP